MKRFRALSVAQKCILLAIGAMALVFCVLYPVTLSRVGFAFRGAILTPARTDAGTVYSGKVGGERVSFTVTADGAATYQADGAVYGPYTVREDASAIPAEFLQYYNMPSTGVELRRGDAVIFRGCLRSGGEYRMLYDENGDLDGLSLFFSDSEQTPAAEEPTAYEVLSLLVDLQPEHKGQWSLGALGLVVCAMTAVSILYADELFRWGLSFRVRDPESAEPSDWELASRYFTWIALPMLALAMFIMGLR